MTIGGPDLSGMNGSVVADSMTADAKAASAKKSRDALGYMTAGCPAGLHLGASGLCVRKPVVGHVHP